MAILRYGRYSASPEGGFGIIASNKGRGSVFNALSSTIIVYRAGFFGGRNDATAPTSRLAVYGATAGEPDGSRLGLTSSFNPSTSMTGSSGGQKYEADMVTPFVATAGFRYLVLVTALNQPLGHSQVDAVNLPDQLNKDFYEVNISSSSPPSPWSGYDFGYEGGMTVWMEGMINVAPNKPTGILPSGNINSTSFNLESDFSDANETLPNGAAYDKVKRVRVMVRRQGTTTLIMNYEYAATPTEQSTKHTSIPYNGSAVSLGDNLQVQIQHQDQAGAWSVVSDWTNFTINPAGSVAKPTAPTGKQLTLTPGPLVARWTHISALAANRARVRIKQGVSAGTASIVAQTGDLTISSVANNTDASITWAATGFASDTLEWSQDDYWVEVSLRDTAGVWSPYSPAQSFSTDMRPTIPYNRAPTGATPVTALPKLQAFATDDDDIDSSLVYEFEITRADTTFVVRTGTWNSTTNRNEYQTTSTDLPSFQTFSWRVRSYDGTLYSDWSSSISVAYVLGPTVTVTAPTTGSTVTIANPLVTWTVTGQVSYRVQFWAMSPYGQMGTALAVPVLALDSGLVTTGTLSYQVIAGSLKNKTDYKMVVAVTNSAPVTGYSSDVLFTVNYATPVALTGVIFQPTRVGLDSAPTAIQGQWEAPNYPASQVDRIEIRRREVGQTIDQAVLMFRITTDGQLSIMDERPRSGTDYLYSISYFVRVGADLLESDAVEIQARVDLKGTVISAMVSGTVLRAELVYVRSTKHKLNFDQVKRKPLGAKKGRSIRGSFQSWDWDGVYRLRTDNNSTANQKIDQIRAMVEQAGAVCIRDERRRVQYSTIDSYEEVDLTLGRFDVALSFSEEYVLDGVVDV